MSWTLVIVSFSLSEKVTLSVESLRAENLGAAGWNLNIEEDITYSYLGNKEVSL